MKQLLHTFLLVLLLLPGYTLLAQEQQLEVTRIAPKVYVHTSYRMFGDVKFPSHGMLVSTREGIVLIDTGWGSEPTKQLLQWIKTNLRQPIKACVVTHFHDDRRGGTTVLQQAGIPVISSALTALLATQDEMGMPDLTFTTDTTFRVGGQEFQVYYPGRGHTSDNLVVYLPKENILFGGCLVKDAKAKNLGNTTDADTGNWANAIRNVQQRFPKTKIVIPSHGPWGDQTALSHTLELLQKQ
ncbi:MAG: subclass B1 metallo-beta-lactamase [Hymenobacteraceae bacterium]|nr:subclass B1 metallo-beta-lactamase [Hymenobacteraceae bacterium]